MDTDDGTKELDLVVITCAVDIDLPVERCWARICSFTDAGTFLDVPSKLVVGDGGIGSVRQIGDAILEAMVGRTDASYTYVQTKGPMAPFLYHGCVALTSTGADGCSLTYTITYNQAPMDDTQRASEHARISGRFRGAAEAMKRVAQQEEAA